MVDHQSIERAYRRHWGDVTGALARQFGTHQLESIEAATQEAFIKAMELWPEEGEPDNPAGWLLTVARRKILDDARKRTVHRRKEDDVIRHIESADFEGRVEPDARLSGEFSDDQVKMLFVCCDPVNPQDACIPLTLRSLCGFGVTEIAQTFLVSEDAMEKRLVRARKALRDTMAKFDLPEQVDIEERLDTVLNVLYLIFNEGYSAHTGDDQIRTDLADEAIRLAGVLAAHPRTNGPRVQALLALMLLKRSRFDERLSADGELRDLWEQDRDQWDKDMIARGMTCLNYACRGNELTSFHLEALIAACHAQAKDADSTNWTTIASLYERLLAINPSPVVKLQLAVAVGFRDGADAGLKEIRKLASEPKLDDYYLYHACLGDFARRAGRLDEAASAFAKAKSLAVMPAEKRALDRKIAALRPS